MSVVDLLELALECAAPELRRYVSTIGFATLIKKTCVFIALLLGPFIRLHQSTKTQEYSECLATALYSIFSAVLNLAKQRPSLAFTN
jgi:hypothetical protein